VRNDGSAGGAIRIECSRFRRGKVVTSALAFSRMVSDHRVQTSARRIALPSIAVCSEVRGAYELPFGSFMFVIIARVQEARLDPPTRIAVGGNEGNPLAGIVAHQFFDEDDVSCRIFDLIDRSRAHPGIVGDLDLVLTQEDAGSDKQAWRRSHKDSLSSNPRAGKQ